MKNWQEHQWTRIKPTEYYTKNGVENIRVYSGLKCIHCHVRYSEASNWDFCTGHDYCCCKNNCCDQVKISIHTRDEIKDFIVLEDGIRDEEKCTHQGKREISMECENCHKSCYREETI